MRIFHQINVSFLLIMFALTFGCSRQQMETVEEAAQDVAGDVKEAAGDLTEAMGEGFAAASRQAAQALEGVEGGGQLLQDVTNFFDSTRKSLQGITDGASANAALSELTSLAGSLDGWTALLDKLPAAAKSAVQAVIEQGVSGLKTVADKVLALPGVSEVLQPTLDEMMTKLQSFTG